MRPMALCCQYSFQAVIKIMIQYWLKSILSSKMALQLILAALLRLKWLSKKGGAVLVVIYLKISILVLMAVVP